MSKSVTSKRLNWVLIVSALAAFSLSLNSCAKTPKKGIVGKWSRLDETWPAQKSPRNLGFEYTVTIEFLEDGTYKLGNEFGDMLGYPGGKYKVIKSGDGESLVLDKIGIDGLNVHVKTMPPPGFIYPPPPPTFVTQDAKYGIKIEGEKLTLTAEDKGESAFLRVEQ
jgi:hypothetical protein